MSANLKLWITDTEREVRSLRRSVVESKIILIGLLIFPAIGIFFGDPLFILLAIANSAPPSIFILVQRIKYKRQLERVDRELQPPDKWFESSSLRRIVTEGHQALIPSAPTLDVRLSLTGAISASVYQAEQKSILVVTLGLVNLSFKNINRARGIIYHELAHILHRDTDIFDFATSLGRGLELFWISFVTLWIAGYILDMVFFSGWYNPITQLNSNHITLAPLALIGWNAMNITQMRLKSEILADIEAAKLLGAGVMIDAIQNCVKDDKLKIEKISDTRYFHLVGSSDRFHPNRDLRILALTNMPYNVNEAA